MFAEVTGNIGKAISRPGQPKPALESLCAAYRDEIGFDQLTMTCMRFPAAASGRITSGYRVFSSHPQMLSVGVEVAFNDPAWVEALIVEKRNLVMGTPDQYRPYYSGWTSLQNLGLQSAFNQPVIVNDITIGTINLMSRTAHYFSAEKVEAANQLHTAAALTMILCAHALAMVPDLTLQEAAWMPAGG